MTPKSSDPIKEIRDQVKKFEPSELLYYTTLLGSLPGNEIKCVRLETLFKIIISTRQKKFKNSTFHKEDVKTLLNSLESFTTWDFFEDYIPTELLDYPAIWILGKRYNVFSGPQDRAHEFWKELISDYFPIRSEFHVKGYDPVEVIKEILSLETTLVSLIRQHKKKLYKVGGLSIPSPKLFESWKHVINEWYNNSPNKTFYEQHSVRLGRKINYKCLVEREPLETICRHFAINFDHCLVPIFQHNLFDFLDILFLSDFKYLKNQNTSLSYDTSSRLRRRLLKLFPDERNILPRFSVKNSPEVDFAVIFDSNKIFLFKILHLDFVDDQEKHLEKFTKVLKTIDEILSKSERNFSVCGIHAVLRANIKYEIIPVILIKSESRTISSKKTQGKPLFWIDFLSFLSLSDDIQNGMEFLKFLRRYNEFRETTQVITFHPLDLYAQYVANGDCFLRSGTMPHMMCVAPGNWASYYIEKLKKKPDFQPRFDDNEPDDVWDVNMVSDNIVQVHNYLTGQTAGVFRIVDRMIWMLTSSANSNYNSDEIQSFDFLTQLIPHRLVKNDAFEKFLQKTGVKPDQQIQFMLQPGSFITRQKFNKLLRVSSELSAKRPIIVKARHTQTKKHVFDIVYSMDLLSNLFESDYLSAEKAIVRSVLNGISREFLELSSYELEEFLKQIFSDAEAAFSIVAMRHELPLSASMLGNYTTTLKSDTAEVQRIIAEFLSNESVQPGTYYGEDAKNIIDKIANFLQIKLVQKLKMYNIENILSYSVHVEGILLESRAILTNEARKNSGQIKEFDPREKYHLKNMEISKLSTVIRFAIEKTIQIDPRGNSFLSKEKWLEIQALSEEIVTVVMERNMIHFKTGKFTIQINDDYSFQILASGIDAFVKHSQNLDDERISKTAAPINWDLQPNGMNNFFSDVNFPFSDEFHISFQDFLKILECCMHMPIEAQKRTIAIDRDELILYIKSKCPQIKTDAIINGLELASLTNDHLVGVTIYPTDLINRKFRSIVKPIPVFKKNNQAIYVINSWKIKVSRQRWISDMDVGHLPFAINDGRRENIKSKKLKEKLQELRQKAAKKHEENVNTIIKRKTLYCDSKIKRNEKCFSKISEPTPGEVDNLSVYPNSKKVILIEAKHLYGNLSSQEIRKEIKKYTKVDGFIEKLLNKKQYVSKHLRSILEYYEINSFDEDWKVECYFVTATIAFPIPLPEGIKSMRIDELTNMSW